MPAYKCFYNLYSWQTYARHGLSIQKRLQDDIVMILLMHIGAKTHVYHGNRVKVWLYFFFMRVDKNIQRRFKKCATVHMRQFRQQLLL